MISGIMSGRCAQAPGTVHRTPEVIPYAGSNTGFSGSHRNSLRRRYSGWKTSRADCCCHFQFRGPLAVNDEAIAYHEGIPGHHMQLSIQRQLTGIPNFGNKG